MASEFASSKGGKRSGMEEVYIFDQFLPFF